MTKKQRNAILRLLLDDLEEIAEETDEKKRSAKLKIVIEHIRDAIED